MYCQRHQATRTARRIPRYGEVATRPKSFWMVCLFGMKRKVKSCRKKCLFMWQNCSHQLPSCFFFPLIAQYMHCPDWGNDPSPRESLTLTDKSWGRPRGQHPDHIPDKRNRRETHQLELQAYAILKVEYEKMPQAEREKAEAWMTGVNINKQRQHLHRSEVPKTLHTSDEGIITYTPQQDHTICPTSPVTRPNKPWAGQ